MSKKSRTMKDDVIYPDLSYQIVGLCFDVHNEIGRSRSEKSYGDALEEKFLSADLDFEREKSLPPSFEGEEQRRNITDFIIEDKIILELKARRSITKKHYYQMKRYLATGGKKLGIIVNFRQKYLHPKRVINS